VKHVINGKFIEITTSSDGTVNAAELRKAAGIPDDRPVIIQMLDGTNRLVNANEDIPVCEKQTFSHASAHSPADNGQKTRQLSETQIATIQSHVKELSKSYSVSLDEQYRYVIVRDVPLPEGFSHSKTPLLIEFPPDCPETRQRGLMAYKVYVPVTLRYQECLPRPLYVVTRPSYEVAGFGPLGWWSYKSFYKNPGNNDLITLVWRFRLDTMEPDIVGVRTLCQDQTPAPSPQQKFINWLRRFFHFLT
jgi:hypothetical protein